VDGAHHGVRRGRQDGACLDRLAAPAVPALPQPGEGARLAISPAEVERVLGLAPDGLAEQGTGVAAGPLLGRRLPEGADVRGELALLQRRVIDLADDVRALSHELHPGVLRHAGLVATLRAHAAESGSRQPINVTIDAAEGINDVRPGLALCLYRSP
jgi:hypothetical protein